MQNRRFSLKRIGYFMPFTWHLILFGILAFAGYRWLNEKASVPDSSYKDIFTLLLFISLLFIVIFICFGIFSVTVSFLFFKWKQRNNQVSFKINTPVSSDTEDPRQLVAIQLHPVLKPLMGFIRIRLRYDGHHYSEKFSLVKPTAGKIFNTMLDGVYNWNLPEIKEYRVEKVILYFEDLFRFFSFALSVDTNSGFHTKPKARTVKEIKAFPRKTEDTVSRIEELRKVEGELINYKNFESNDDVRRIVWKIYAKNKELVVRVPEIIDPYASHIYFYASFFSAFNTKGNEVIEVPFLNFYKTICWSVYTQLVQKGLEVRFVPDQEIPQHAVSDAAEQVKYAITASNWHENNDLKSYFRSKDASVIMISSLSNAEQVKELIASHGSQISFVFVPLTESLFRQGISDLLQWIFVQKEKDKASVYRTNWSLSLLRPKIIENENAIRRILKDYSKSLVLSVEE